MTISKVYALQDDKITLYEEKECSYFIVFPENDKYEPIQMRGDQIAIIGVAVGILKRE